MEKKEKFIRVGTTLYKIVNQPRIDGGYVRKRIAWNSETLRQDYGKDYMAGIPKYDGFCTVPDHVGYQSVVGKFLNLYEPISHQPQEGDFPCIRSLVEHIFGEQYCVRRTEHGQKHVFEFLKGYLPKQRDVQHQRGLPQPVQFRLGGQLLIMVDEVLLNRREDSERLKNLSTTLSYKVEAKGKDRDEIGFFAKFVLCSNNEHLPVIIDAGETRYWVRKIVPLRSDDTDFLQKLKAEIPAFLHFLQHRQLSTEKESRMWFNPKRLETDALRKIIRSNRNRLEIEMAELLLDIMASVGVGSVSFCLNDIVPLLVCSQVKVEKSQVRKVVQECWKLAPASNSLSYTTYQYDYNRECHYSPVRRIGRYYTVSKELLETL